MTYTLSYDSQLLDECLMTAGIVADPSQVSPLAVYQNENGASEALVIHQGGELCHAVREPLSDSGWNVYGVGARLASAALIDGSTAYAVGNNDGFQPQGFVRTLNKGVWGTSGLAYSVWALYQGWDGTIWANATQGQEQLLILQLVDGAWQPAATLNPGGPAITSVAGSAGDLWVVDAAGDVTNYAQNPQTLPPCEAGAGGVMPTPDGDIWMFDSNGVLYQLEGQQWQPAAHAPGFFSWMNSDGRGNLWGIYQQTQQSPNVLGYAGTDGVWRQLELPTGTGVSGASVGLDGSVLMLDQNGVAWIMAGGPGGTWQRQMTPTGMYGVTSSGGQVTEVVAGQDAQQRWHAFYVQGGELYQLDYGAGGWGSNNLIASVGGQIGLTNDQTSGELIGYGVSADGNFLVFQGEGGGTFQSSEYAAGGALAGATPNLTVINDDMWVTTAVIGGRLTQIWGSKAGPTTYPDTPVQGFFPVNETDTQNGPRNMKQVLRLPWVQAESNLPYAVVTDDDGNIFMVSDLELVISLDPATEISQGTYTLLAGAGVSAMGGVTGAGAIIGADGYARIYATDESYQVWVMRQTGGGDPWTWGQWHPLGDNCSYLANGPGALQTTELFTISADNLLYLIDQNADTQRWDSSLIKRPAGAAEDFDELTLYKTEVAVLDEDGRPAAGVQVNVQAVEPALLWVEGVQYTLAAGQTAAGTTNAMGKVRITTPAAGLHTSPLVVTPDGGVPQTVYAPQHVHDFLAGNATLGAGRTFTADGAALTNATDYNGDPYTGFPGMAQDPNVPAASAVIMQLAQAQPQTSGARPTAFIREPAGAAALGESFWDKVWDDMVDYAEDVFYAIRNGVIKVVNVVYDAAQSAVTATVRFVDDAVDRVIKFVVSTYHDIANALHTAFQWIKAGVDKLLDWLKSLFDWESIMYTQQVFAYYMEQAIPWLRQQVKEGEVLVNNFFQNLEGDVTQWFEWLKQYLGTQTVNDTGSGASTGTQIDFKGMKFLAGIFHFGTGVNWLLEKVESYLFGSSAASLNPVAVVQQAAQTFWNVSQPAWQDLYNAIESFKNFVQNSVSHPGDFKQLVASDLVNAVEEVILAALQFADAVVEAFLALVAAALEYVDELLTYNIDIPLVTKLYEKYVGQPLTALNLFTMLLAVPVTVGYKLASGNRYLFTEQQVQQITGSSDAGPARAEAIKVDPGLQTAFYFCSGAVTLVWAGFDTALDAYQQTPPLGLQILDIIFPTVLQVFGWPTGVPFTSIPLETGAEKWGFGNWIVGWAPIPLNIALLLIGTKLDPESSKVARYSDPVGKGILTGVGLLNLGVGAAASGLGQKDGSVSDAGVAANTLSPMPNLFQWLRLSSLEEASDEVTYLIKLLVDFFTGAGTAVSIFVEGNQTS